MWDNFRNWFRHSWFSCEEYAKRASKALDGELLSDKKPGYLFHHYWCFTCRHFAKQLKKLQLEIANLTEDLESVAPSESPSDGLSTEGREKISLAIKNLTSL